jgi:uncharacterized protein YegL
MNNNNNRNVPKKSQPQSRGLFKSDVNTINTNTSANHIDFDFNNTYTNNNTNQLNNNTVQPSPFTFGSNQQLLNNNIVPQQNTVPNYSYPYPSVQTNIPQVNNNINLIGNNQYNNPYSYQNLYNMYPNYHPFHNPGPMQPNNNMVVDNWIFQIGYNDDEEIPNQSLEVKFNNNIDINMKQDSDLGNVINVQMQLSKSHVKETSKGVTLPLLLDIDVKDMNTDKRANIDLICLLDKSGSMQGSKIELLIKSFTNIMDFLGDNDRLSIVTFDDRSTKLTPLTRMNETGKARTLQILSRVSADGGTCIGTAVEEALRIIAGRKKANTVTSILILSDGLDSSAENMVKKKLEGYQHEIKETFTINTFGYGNDHDPKMMSALAQLRDGSFYFIDKLDTVDNVFVDCVGGLVSVIAQNMKIEVRPNVNDENLRGIDITKAYGVDGFWKKRNGFNYNAELLQVISGKKYSYILEFFIPKLHDLEAPVRTFLLAQAAISFTDNNGLKYTKQCECDITFVEDDSGIQPNTDVFVNYYRVKTAEVTNEAIKLSGAGQYDKATFVLNQLRYEMSTSPVGNHQTVINLIKDVDNALKNVKPEVFNVYGKHYMFENAMANMSQQSNFNANNCYQNNNQQVMFNCLNNKKQI